MGHSHTAVSVHRKQEVSHEVFIEGMFIERYKDIQTANLVADAFCSYFWAKERTVGERNDQMTQDHDNELEWESDYVVHMVRQHGVDLDDLAKHDFIGLLQRHERLHPAGQQSSTHDERAKGTS